jgi:hypothetical protein
VPKVDVGEEEQDYDDEQCRTYDFGGSLAILQKLLEHFFHLA